MVEEPHSRAVRPTSSRPFWNVQEQQRRGRSVEPDAASESTHATGARRLRRTLSRPFWRVQEQRRLARTASDTAATTAESSGSRSTSAPPRREVASGLVTESPAILEQQSARPAERRMRPTSSRPFWGVQEQRRRGRSAPPSESSESTQTTGVRRLRRTLAPLLEGAGEAAAGSVVRTSGLGSCCLAGGERTGSRQQRRCRLEWREWLRWRSDDEWCCRLEQQPEHRRSQPRRRRRGRKKRQRTSHPAFESLLGGQGSHPRRRHRL